MASSAIARASRRLGVAPARAARPLRARVGARSSLTPRASASRASSDDDDASSSSSSSSSNPASSCARVAADDAWHRLETRWEADEEGAMEGPLLDLLSPAWRIMLLSDGSVTRHLRLLCPRLRKARLECTRQGPVGDFAAAGGRGAMPDDVALIEGPLVRREVLLRIDDAEWEWEEEEELELELELEGDGGAAGAETETESESDENPSNPSAIPPSRFARSPGGPAASSSLPAVYAASWWSEETFKTYMTDDESPMWTNLRSQNVELYREVRRVYLGDNAALEAVFGAEGPFWGRHYIFWHEGEPMTVVYEVFNPALERQLGPSGPRKQKPKGGGGPGKT